MAAWASAAGVLEGAEWSRPGPHGQYEGILMVGSASALAAACIQLALAWLCLGIRGIALVLAPVEPARRLADDLVPVNRHPGLQPGVTGIFLRRRPHAQQGRAAVGADPDQVEGLRALRVLGCQLPCVHLGAGEMRRALPGWPAGPWLGWGQAFCCSRTRWRAWCLAGS